VEDLRAYFKRAGLDPEKQRDRAIVGRRLGYDDQTAVYRYLSGKWQGDLRKFEKRLTSFLANELRLEGGGDLVDDPKAFILPSMFAFFNQVRACGMINVGHGPAGTGKSCASRIYRAKHKDNTVYTHVWAWGCGKAALARELCRSAGIEPRRGELPTVALARHFRDGQMMFIIDNAQRLTASARNWLADFTDYTGAPVALIGNPEISAQWSRVDQHSRRVGLHRNVSIDLFDEDERRNTSATTVDYLLSQHLPTVAGNKTIRTEALKIITGPKTGSCGAFVQHARLTRLLMEGGITDPVKAFHSAATQLLKVAA
jgi:hypothetical protein